MVLIVLCVTLLCVYVCPSRSFFGGLGVGGSGGCLAGRGV